MDSCGLDAMEKTIQKPLSACRHVYSVRVEKSLEFYQKVFEKIQIRDVVLHIMPNDGEGNPVPHIIEYNGRCRIRWYIAPIKYFLVS
jgi:hypothetical protein